MKLVDTHAHLDYVVEEGLDATEVLNRAKENGLVWLINPSVTLERIPTVLKLAEAHDCVYAAVAIHPCEVHQSNPSDWAQQLESYLTHPKVVAIGETGLDYYWDASTKAQQHDFLHTFLRLSSQYKLPIVIHSRAHQEDQSLDTNEDFLAMVKEYPDVKGVMHCFSGDGAFALKMVERGFYISFAGNVTFKKATNLHKAAQTVPLEWILIETDSPYLSPMPHRGKNPNEPGRVLHVAEKIAELRGIDVETVAEATTANAQRLFGVAG